MLFKWLKEKLLNKRSTSLSKHVLSSKQLKELESVVGYKITNTDIYSKAFSHRSLREENLESFKSYERLEFLGDSVLGLLTADYLFKEFPEADEGFLTKSRAQIVSTKSLISIAQKLNLRRFILANGNFLSGNNSVEKVCADSLEALIGAIYLDSGIEEAKRFVKKYILLPLSQSGFYKEDNNFKGQLLELTHTLKMENPRYVVKEERGPEHNKEFTVDVVIGGEVFGTGEGKSKKNAEQKSAEAAIQRLVELKHD